jgi:predicted ATPase/signal transduction histidine kinase
MGLTLTGYRDVRLLRSSGQVRVYEAIRRTDELAVIAKAFDRASDDVESQVEHEFAAHQSLAIGGLARALELRRIGEDLVLVVERPPGVSLAKQVDGRGLELSRVLDVGLELATILERLHERRIVHRNIKPSSVWVEPGTGRVTLGDVGVAALIERELRGLHDPVVCEDTLPYVAPEQTGRIGRAVDLRSDLYSFGVLLYELLTGQRPFAHRDPLELIHAHLARVPESPRTLRPSAPEALTGLIQKLLAKAPEHRYQTAAGLRADLHRIAAGEQRFELGRADIPRELRLPHQLYGRVEQRAELLHELERAGEQGGARAVWLTGPAGIGKSALIDDVVVEFARLGARVVRGRFPRHLERPYAGFREAFGGLVEQLLTEPEGALESWRARLHAALGGVGQVVVELLPKLELIIGEQPKLAALGPHEARNRLHLAIARFTSVFRADRCALVLVLEDLQWADPGSLALLAALLATCGDQRHGPLLVIGSLRDDLELSGPRREFVDRLKQGWAHAIELGPLPDSAVVTLLAETFARSAAQVSRLARVITRKTANNPLRIRALLTHLVDAGLMRPGDDGWTWDDAEIEGESVLDDMLEVMHARLAALPGPAGVLLQHAACIGDHFDLSTLQVVCAGERAELTATLYELVDAGLLGRVGGEYRFAHPEIRELAYRDADAELRRRAHWALGRHLVADDVTDERLFAIVDHLDAGFDDAGRLELGERVELAELNRRAGQRSLAGAYELALRYFERGLAALGDAPATVPSHYALLVGLELGRARALAVCGQRTAADQAFESLLGRPLDAPEYVGVAAHRIADLRLSGRSVEALSFARSALERYGCVSVEPNSLSSAQARARLEGGWRRLAALDLGQLLALPRCTDARASAVMALLSAAKNAAYVVDPNLYVALICEYVEWLLDHGTVPGVSMALTRMAICVGTMLDEVEGAIQLSEHAQRLGERDDDGPTLVQAESAALLFVDHLGRPFAEPLARIDGAYARALEVGDFLWAGYTGAVALSMNLEVGTHLQVIERRCRRFEHELGDRGSSEAAVVAATLRGLALVLGGVVEDDAALDPEQLAARGGSRYSLYATIANRALACLVLGEFSEALALSLRIFDAIEQVMFGSWIIPRVALTIVTASAWTGDLGGDLGCDSGTRERAMQVIRRWAANSSVNYGHYCDLADGLLALAAADLRSAARLLERARVHAAQQGCRWVEGLAAEALATLAEREGLAGYAAGARRQAWEAYAAWGAWAKLARSRATHADEMRGLEAESSPQSAAGELEFDLDSVLRSVAAIAADLRLEQVIVAVLEAAMTNAGADRGALVLERGGISSVVAEAKVGGERKLLAQPIPLAELDARGPASLIRYVRRTGQAVVLADARVDPRFAEDPYVRRVGARSLLGLPIMQGQQCQGVLVLENRLSPSSFTPAHLRVLELIAGQAASVLEHARIHAALREGEARWRSLVDGSPDAIALIDQDGEIEFASRRVFEQFEGKVAVSRWSAAVDAALREGEASEFELELSGEVEPPRWVVVRLAPIELAGEVDRPRKAIAVATDVSARKRAEADKRALEAQVRQQQRLESIGTLASGVAHEINNPIQGIMNYAELIAGAPDNRALVEEFAGEITHESERVATIVRNLLAFSRREGLQPATAVDLRELVTSTLSLIHSLIRRDQIQLVITIPTELPRVQARPQEIQQVIMNLVTNARDALNAVYPGYDERKRITIDAEVRRSASAAWVRLIVEDSGPGIPAAIQARIFDPFFTTKGRDEGTGLGLAVSHGIAQDHGGALTVESEPGHGARFLLDLPVAPDSPSE